MNSAEVTLGRVGLGCMGMSDFYGPADELESISTIHAALDRGITLLDTGDFYGSGRNEMLIRKAIEGRRGQVFLSVKFGGMRGPDGSFIGWDMRPAAVKNFLAYSLRRLGTDYIDLYQPCRVDQAVPLEDTIGAIADMVRAGYVRHIGISEASAASLRKAHAVHPIAALQIEYSLMSRGIETDILPTARELGVPITAYGILARGQLAGSRLGGAGDMRHHMPRFAGENLSRNQELVDALATVAESLNSTSAQVATAWVLSRGSDIIPLIGARRREQLNESMAAVDLHLTQQQLARIEAAIPSNGVAGTRYPEAQMQWLDSERPVR